MMFEEVSNQRSSPKLKLYYFDIPGKAEAIRLACAYGKLDWVDIRLTREEFMEMKTSGALRFGQVPMLEVVSADGSVVQLTQSSAIIKYVGKFAGLYPVNDDLLAALIDSILDQEVDCFMGLTCSRYRARFGFECLTEEDVANVRKALNDVVLPGHLQHFENLLMQSSSGWIANTSEPTVADFVLALRFKWLIEPGVNDGISSTLLDNHTRIKAMIAKFDNLPSVIEYYAQK